MPRTTTLGCPGCPPLRALSFDVLGLCKVTEARSKDNGVAKVVNRWSDPDSSRAILAASIDDSKSDPIELMSPISGEVCFSAPNDSPVSAAEDPVVGLHLFKKQKMVSSSRSRNLLTCSSKGRLSLSIVELHTESSDTKEEWSVCNSGEFCCSKVHDDEGYSVFGGKGVELNMWDKLFTSNKHVHINMFVYKSDICFHSAADFINTKNIEDQDMPDVLVIN